MPLSFMISKYLQHPYMDVCMRSHNKCFQVMLILVLNDSVFFIYTCEPLATRRKSIRLISLLRFVIIQNIIEKKKNKMVLYLLCVIHQP